MAEPTWIYHRGSLGDCIATCKKEYITIFNIYYVRNGFIAEYFDSTLFKSPVLTYGEIKKRMGAKEYKTYQDAMPVICDFFLEDYRKQVNNQMEILQRMKL